MDLELASGVQDALEGGRPVVALESTLIAHGLPWPVNRDAAMEAEQAIRDRGATPATIAVWEGRPTVGLSPSQIEAPARHRNAMKASRRDLAVAIAGLRTAATTVAATMFLAHRAGIRIFATGGIGGVHRGVEQSGDVSADLTELAQTPVAVVCSGAKNILDLRRTLEMLETLSVPVLGYRTDRFPAFYVAGSEEAVPVSIESAEQAADIARVHWSLGGAGLVIAQPVPSSVALSAEDWETAWGVAERRAAEQGIRGAAVTPFLLAQVAELTEGRTLRANQALLVENARLAAAIACALV